MLAGTAGVLGGALLRPTAASSQTSPAGAVPGNSPPGSRYGDPAWWAKRKEEILEPALEIVDPHHHLWDRDEHRYLLDQLLADTGSGHNITHSVFMTGGMDIYRLGYEHGKGGRKQAPPAVYYQEAEAYRKGYNRGARERGTEWCWYDWIRRHDGGRKDSGFKGNAKGDCFTRAVAIVTEQPYREIYREVEVMGKAERPHMSSQHRSSARNGVYEDTMARYMASIDWQWVPVQGMHLRPDELPEGRIICSSTDHVVAVIDGVVWDAGEPTCNGTVLINGYWKEPER
jgi:hypothetical protein